MVARSIEKRKVRDGIIRPRPRNFLADELPEALYLFQNHTDHSYTLETPSELDLGVRVNAQVRMIEAALTLVGYISWATEAFRLQKAQLLWQD